MKIKDKLWKVNQSKKVIGAAIEKWRPSIGVAFTGRKDSTVMMHLIREIVGKEMPKIFFIDHRLHFKESYDFLKHISKMWELNVEWVADKELLDLLKKEKDIDKKREILFDLKIKSIRNAISDNGWKAIITAIRWDENPARAGEQYFSKRDNHWRVHPLLHWTEEDIWNFIKSENIPYNRLYDEGYRSIGSKLFTKKGKEQGEERHGRDKDKEEIMERLRKLGYF